LNAAVSSQLERCTGKGRQGAQFILGCATAERPQFKSFAASEGEPMQYLPGFTVQCINPLCEARGQWLRADATNPIGNDGRCPCCGDFLRNVPPPLGPRFRMRPRSLTARPPLRPRPR
jgi:hypothetical protein